MFYACDNKDLPIQIEVEPIDQSGTDITSFTLTDGIGEYSAFAIIDSTILVKVPNQGDFTRMKANISHNSRELYVDNVLQINGVTENDFSDSTNPVVYTVVSSEGDIKKYKVELFDIPVFLINTEGNASIINREDWLSATLRIIDDESTIEKTIKIKGRGNGSWQREMKAYSIKFDEKESIFGLPKSKRWVLLGHSSDWTKLRTPLSYKISSIAGFDWSPRGYNIELILNDSLRCNYFISEQIRVEKDRINIKEMSPVDTLGEALTGGVLFEVSSDYDEQYKFRTDIGDYPFMFQNPDKNLHPKQFEYFKNYINTLEEIIYSDERLMSCEYLNYMNIDTFIKWWLVHEMTLNMEESWFVKNYYMYKDRGYDKKLTAGPPWDFDWGTYWKKNEQVWLSKEKFWYSRLFLSSYFVSRVKVVWSEIKENYYSSNIDKFFEDLREYNRFSVRRDHFLFPQDYNPENALFNKLNDDDGMPYDEACDYIKGVLDRHIQWIDTEISCM